MCIRDRNYTDYINYNKKGDRNNQPRDHLWIIHQPTTVHSSRTIRETCNRWWYNSSLRTRAISLRVPIQVSTTRWSSVTGVNPEAPLAHSSSLKTLYWCLHRWSREYSCRAILRLATTNSKLWMRSYWTTSLLGSSLTCPGSHPSSSSSRPISYPRCFKTGWKCSRRHLVQELTLWPCRGLPSISYLLEAMVSHNRWETLYIHKEGSLRWRPLSTHSFSPSPQVAAMTISRWWFAWGLLCLGNSETTVSSGA